LDSRVAWKERQPGCFGFHRNKDDGIMRKNKGFTLLEIIVVVGILALATAIAVPNMINWRIRAQLRSAAENLKLDLLSAKSRAARENTDVFFLLDPDQGSYRIYFQRSGADETSVISRSLPPSVHFYTGHPGYTLDDNDTFFTPRGTTNDGGTVVIVNSIGERKTITISSLGRIRIDSI
jgi:type IV fimbrial biogenesis protein FimT